MTSHRRLNCSQRCEGHADLIIQAVEGVLLGLPHAAGALAIGYASPDAPLLDLAEVRRIRGPTAVQHHDRHMSACALHVLLVSSSACNWGCDRYDCLSSCKWGCGGALCAVWNGTGVFVCIYNHTCEQQVFAGPLLVFNGAARFALLLCSLS